MLIKLRLKKWFESFKVGEYYYNYSTRTCYKVCVPWHFSGNEPAEDNGHSIVIGVKTVFKKDDKIFTLNTTGYQAICLAFMTCLRDKFIPLFTTDNLKKVNEEDLSSLTLQTYYAD